MVFEEISLGIDQNLFIVTLFAGLCILSCHSLVPQAGPAGIFTHKEVFSSIYNTIKQVFKCNSLYNSEPCLFIHCLQATKPANEHNHTYITDVPSHLSADVIPYTAHVPSFADTWGWVMVCLCMLEIIQLYNFYFIFLRPVSHSWHVSWIRPLMSRSLWMPRKLIGE